MYTGSVLAGLYQAIAQQVCMKPDITQNVNMQFYTVLLLYR